MKNLWIFNHYAQEPGRAGGTRHYDFSKRLEKMGWSATIVGASIEFNTGYQRLEEKEKIRKENYDGVSFLWVKTPAYSGNGIGRMFNMLVYSARVLLKRTTDDLPRPNVIIGSSVHPFAALAAERLAYKFKVPFIFEVRDLWPQTLVDLGRLSKSNPITKILYALEKRLYQKASRIIVLLPKADEYIEKLDVSLEKVVWLPNGVDIDNFPITPSPIERTEFSLMYFGAHGNANGLDNVLRAMALVKKQYTKKKICLRLIGNGPQKQKLIQLANDLNLDNVFFEEPVPKRMIPSLASEADAFIFNLVDSPVFNYGISSNKLFDFMAASRPIIFCCSSVNNPVSEANAGLTVFPGKPDTLAESIIELAELPNERRIEMGQAGRCFVEENHDFDFLAEKLITVLNDVSNQE